MKRIKKLLFYILGFLLLFVLFTFIYFEFAECGISPYRCGDFSMEKSLNSVEIEVGLGPEDMEVDTSAGYPRLIVSCSPRRKEIPNTGGFYSLNLETDQAKPMTILPTNWEIRPHGIDVVKIDSTHWLYVVAHDSIKGAVVDRILRFEIKGDTLELDFDNIFDDPAILVPNDLHVLSDGSMYVTNFLDKATELRPIITSLGAKTGSIAHYDGKGNWQIVLDKLCYPNGIWVNDAESHLVFANGGCKEIVRYKLESDGKFNLESHISTKDHGLSIPLGDNFSQDVRGGLWNVNHPCPLKFLDHQKDPEANSPIQVYKLDQNTLKAELVYQTNGESISAASTVVFWEGNLYICQVFNPFVLKVNL